MDKVGKLRDVLVATNSVVYRNSAQLRCAARVATDSRYTTCWLSTNLQFHCLLSPLYISAALRDSAQLRDVLVATDSRYTSWCAEHESAVAILSTGWYRFTFCLAVNRDSAQLRVGLSRRVLDIHLGTNL